MSLLLLFQPKTGSGTSSNTSQDVRITGQSTSSLATDTRITGKDTSSTTQNVRIIGDTAYSKTNIATLPTTNAALTSYSTGEVTNVAADDSTYTDMAGSSTYLVHQFGRYNPTQQSITLTWNGKTTKAASTSTVYLQIYNGTTPGWETLATNTTAAANTDFTLTSTQSTSLSNYYDASSTVWARVYQ